MMVKVLNYVHFEVCFMIFFAPMEFLYQFHVCVLSQARLRVRSFEF